MPTRGPRKEVPFHPNCEGEGRRSGLRLQGTKEGTPLKRISLTKKERIRKVDDIPHCVTYRHFLLKSKEKLKYLETQMDLPITKIGHFSKFIYGVCPFTLSHFHSL
jgi:hypothetical protein